MTRLYGYASLLALIALAVGCSNTSNLVHKHYNTAGVTDAAATAPVKGVSVNYLCPDLFEGHVFSCPTIPTVSLGADFNTDSYNIGIEAGCGQAHGGICLSPAIEAGRGSETYGYNFDVDRAAKGAGILDEKLEYNVLQANLHGRYAIPMNADSSVTISPLGGPRLYRFKYRDCPFGSGCSETLLVFDVGVGAQFKNFGLDVYTGLNGPNFSARLKYYLGY